MKRFLLFTSTVLLTCAISLYARAQTGEAPADFECPQGSIAISDAPEDVPTDLLKQARPDQCLSPMRREAVTETYEEKIIVSPAHSEVRTVPATKVKKAVRVLVAPARRETLSIPAVTHTVTEDIVVKPPSSRREVVPAVYGLQTQRVMVKLPRTEWEVSKRELSAQTPITPHDYKPVQIYAAGKPLDSGVTASSDKGTTGTIDNISPDFVYTLKQYPAEYEEQQVRVLLQPETVHEIEIPAVTESRTRVVVDVAEHEETRDIPAVYREEIQEVVSEPGHVETIVVPAVESSVQKQRVITPAGTQWSLISSLRKTPETHATVTLSETPPISAQVQASKAPDTRPTPPSPAQPSVATIPEKPHIAPSPSSSAHTVNTPSPSRTGKFQYKLGPGDKVRVLVFGEPDLTGEFVVSGDGRVSIPLIGEVTAIGLTSPELQENIRSALSPAYVQDARVNVEVLSFRPFYILGEVNKPGEYPFTNGLTVSKAVATASGYTYRANSKKVFIKRDGEDKEVPFDTSSSAVIGPGDVIRIPERFF